MMDWVTELPSSWLTGSGVITMAMAFFWGNYTGYIRTGREVKEKNAEIEWLRLTNAELSDQIRDLIRGTKVAAGALEKVSQVAEGIER